MAHFQNLKQEAELFKFTKLILLSDVSPDDLNPRVHTAKLNEQIKWIPGNMWTLW